MIRMVPIGFLQPYKQTGIRILTDALLFVGR